jgi:dipeptide/tripeptide permease
VTTPKEQLPFAQAIRTFSRAFWAANAMEILERLAYYGVRVVIPIYIASSEDPDGLHFSNTQKGTIFMLWAIVQTLLPMFTGGYADRYGRKLTIAVSIAVKMAGYLLMATQRSYVGFTIGCLVLAAGTAVFKPGLWGTMAVGIDERASGVGWGIFYWLVNVGGFLGPPLAGMLHRLAWKWVFFSCAGIVALNYLMLLTYEDAPGKGEASAGEVLVESVKKLVTRPRLWVFLLVMSGYFVMFMQLFDALPNFIEEWTDTRDVVSLLGLHEGLLAHVTPRGLQVPQEWMINLDAGMVLLLMVPVSALATRLKVLQGIVLGTLVSAAGLLVAGTSTGGTLCLAGIFCFAFGEMLSGPKLYEYLASIAPRGEEALYMGYANVPTAVGWASGAFVAGRIYDALADKANLAIRYLHEHGLATGDVPRTEAMHRLQDALHLDATGATTLLWTTYSPQRFWYGFVATGALTLVGLVSYARFVQRSGSEEDLIPYGFPTRVSKGKFPGERRTRGAHCH